MKIAVIGGGSSYTPELVDGLIEREEVLGLDELCLYDINENRVEIVTNFSKRMAKHANANFEIWYTLNLQEALDGADFVLFQLRVGGQQARHQDILLGLRHGLIGQETTGVGGFAKALRTIPVVLDTAQHIKQLCPNAWIVNFTNPSGIITEALFAAGMEKTVGLCNIPIGLKMEIAAALGANPDEIEMDYAGLNHYSFVRHVYWNGKDYIDKLIEMIEQALLKGAPANIEDMEYPPGFLRNIGAIPSPYLRYFYLTEYMLKKLKQKPKTRAQEVMEIERKLFEIYADESVVEKPQELSLRGGAYYSRIAVKIIESLMKEQPTDEIVITQAKDAFPGIEDHQTVEIPAMLSSNGVEPKPLPYPLERHLLAGVQNIKHYETLTVEAALEKSYKKAWQALAIHPLCGPEKATDVLEDILSTFSDYIKDYT